MSQVMNDQELDKLIRQVANDAALDDAAIDEIADSPALWWSVQRDVRKAAPAKAPWPPNLFRRLLIMGIPVAAAIIISGGLYVNSLRTASDERARGETPATVQPGDNTTATQPPISDAPSITAPIAAATKDPSRPPRAVRAIGKPRRVTLPQTSTARVPSTAIKSDFVALAYAQDPQSGQLVRVKVPRSMMVSLGVVPTVSDPSKLIDAEVIVGDDGLTHAIRFIRQ